MTEKKIGFVGTDGRTLLAAVETSRSRSELYPGAYRGVVVKGTGAMEPFAQKMGWPVDFIPVPDNSAPSYAAALIRAFQTGELDVALVMPEGLLFEGLVDRVTDAGFGDRIIGMAAAGVEYEADKIAGKRSCEQAGIPVAPAWAEVEARDYPAVLKTCLACLHDSSQRSRTAGVRRTTFKSGEEARACSMMSAPCWNDSSSDTSTNSTFSLRAS